MSLLDLKAQYYNAKISEITIRALGYKAQNDITQQNQNYTAYGKTEFEELATQLKILSEKIEKDLVKATTRKPTTIKKLL